MERKAIPKVFNQKAYYHLTTPTKMGTNKHGLGRDIPSEVKRTIRQQSGFGCVVCGTGLYEYEHVDPEFKDATEHDPTRMALLCPSCHTRVTKQTLPKQMVKEAMKDPACKRAGFSKDIFYVGYGVPYIQIGGVKLRRSRTPVEVDGYPLFKIDKPETPDGPFRFSGTFTDSSGRASLLIVDNEWKALISNWDVEITGRSITIREYGRKIHLRLIQAPPDGLIVERLEMRLGRWMFEANAHQFIGKLINGGGFTMKNCLLDGGEVGLRLS